jgi:hypothetical protein
MVKGPFPAPETTPSPTLNALRDRSPPEFLYHYASNAAMIGIAEAGSVYATHIHFLNDTGEMRYGRVLLFDEIDMIVKGLTSDDERDFVEQIRNNVAFYSEISPAFLTSFCDDLSLAMFRMYCLPDEGFALGIDGPELRGLAKGQLGELSPCSYCESEQRAICRELIEGMLDLYRSQKPQSQVKHFNLQYASYPANTILRSVLPLFKHQSFKAEREWRVILSQTAQMRFRLGIRGITPYVLFPLKPGATPFMRVLTGPSSTDFLLRQKATKLLLSCRFGDVPVEEFQTTYL